jgi:hypothetical protein
MTTFNYYPNIPNPPDNPSFDVSLMQTNSGSINSIVGTDHLTFKQAQGGGPGVTDGQHKQVTFANTFPPSGTPTNPLSILYTTPGTANTVTDMRYINNNGTFPVNLIRAYGFCTAAGVSADQQINVATFARTPGFGAGSFDITLTTNTVTGLNFGVLVSASPTGTTLTSVYIINSSGPTFTLKFFTNLTLNLLDPVNFTFIVLQI